MMKKALKELDGSESSREKRRSRKRIRQWLKNLMLLRSEGHPAGRPEPD